MKPTVIKYERKFNLTNYEHEVVSIEVALGDGDSASVAMSKAMMFVKETHNKSKGMYENN